MGPRDVPAGNTFTGAVTPPKALVPGIVAVGLGNCDEEAALKPSPGKAAKNSLASCARVLTSIGLCTSLVGVGIVMELSNFNVFQDGQCIIRLHHQGAIQADQIRGDGTAVDAHEAN